jgi:hypothetical protein
MAVKSAQMEVVFVRLACLTGGIVRMSPTDVALYAQTMTKWVT